MPSIGRPVRVDNVAGLYLRCTQRLLRHQRVFVAAAISAPLVELIRNDPVGPESDARAVGRPDRGSTEQPSTRVGKSGGAVPSDICHPDGDGASPGVHQRSSQGLLVWGEAKITIVAFLAQRVQGLPAAVQPSQATAFGKRARVCNRASTGGRNCTTGSAGAASLLRDQEWLAAHFPALRVKRLAE